MNSKNAASYRRLPPSVRSGGLPSCRVVTFAPWRKPYTIKPNSRITQGIPSQGGRLMTALPYSFLPIATAVSAMRLEKPHSLSYQDITRTKLPFCTLVWSMWNVDECGSWLKSIETFGAVV
jgi:hypothetical protein